MMMMVCPDCGQSVEARPDTGGMRPVRHECTRSVGMTVRDYFAAAALTGWLADGHVNADPYEDACVAYRLADAMLAAREAKTDE